MGTFDRHLGPGAARRPIGRRHFLRMAAGGASALALAACGRPLDELDRARPGRRAPDPRPAPTAAPPASAPTALPAPAAHGAVGSGGFGRLFPTLAAASYDDAALVRLADAMIAPPETDEQGRLMVTPESERDDEENYGLPAGYTYFGQFVDHDITFDPRTSLGAAADPRGLVNARTPALDLDGLYGRGPDEMPYLYTGDGRRFVLGDRVLTGALAEGGPIRPLGFDLPRLRGRAIIGDKRNDENVIVSQLQGFFMRFHNFMADSYPDRSFAEIQRLVRWHYQWLVLFDYLPRIIGREQVIALLPQAAGDDGPLSEGSNVTLFNWRDAPFMPLEFSGAAYRFGHSLVRPVYRLSAADLVSSAGPGGLEGRRALFTSNPADGLNGFGEFPAENGIDWALFFDTRDRPLVPDMLGKSRVQPAYKTDTSLVAALGFLPEFSRPGSASPAGAPNTNSLAFRNLKRGVMLQLPTGQELARQMGLDPIPDERLLVGKATAEDLRANPSVAAIDPRFSGAAPLWFYILAEAQDRWRQAAEAEPNEEAKDLLPTLLGPVGGRIVGEVLIGLLLADPDSFLRAEPTWRPLLGDGRVPALFDRFTMGDLVTVLPPVDEF
ncbi:MAG TPA: peroxidase family protein [Roseiflexaceae bacterium]|nr:peroxidase family protein [Roseiflexaceae bacterium]